MIKIGKRWRYEKIKKKVKRGKENEKWIKDLRDGVERVCSMYEKCQEDSAYAEVQCELLVDELKDKLCSIRHESQYEYYLDFEEIKNEIGKEFFLDIREEYFERETNVKLKEIEEEENYEIDKKKEL